MSDQERPQRWRFIAFKPGDSFSEYLNYYGQLTTRDNCKPWTGTESEARKQGERRLGPLKRDGYVVTLESWGYA